MPVVRSRILAIVAALLVGLSGGVAARAQYFCHMLGQVVPTCCCESQQAVSVSTARRLAVAQAVAHTAPEVRARACCELVPSAAPATAPGTRDALFDVPSLALLASGPHLLTRWKLGRPVDAAPIDARQRPVHGPPLFLANCVFLI
jgi:hypothetical protein